MSDNPITREEFQQLARRVETLESLIREGLQARERTDPPPAHDHVHHTSPVPAEIASSPAAAEKQVQAPETATSATPSGTALPGREPPPASPSYPNARPASPPPPASAPQPERTTGIEWERIVGTQWLPKVGAFVLILGIAFFLQYAFSQGWVTPEMRIVMGIALGAGFIAAGEASQHRNLRSYGHVLAALGLGTEYLSIYAGSELYGIFGQTATVGLLSLISIAGAFLSLRFDTQPLAVMAAVGAYLAPVLVSGGGTGEPSLTYLNYLVVVSGGFAALAFYKGWRGVQGLAFAATWILSWGTLADLGERGEFLMALGYATIFYGEFLAASVALRFRVREPAQDSTDLMLLLGNPALFFAAAYAILHTLSPLWESWLTALAFGLAALYTVLMEVSQGREDPLLKGAATALAAGFMTAGFSLGLPQWATLAWCVEALVLLWAGFARGNELLRTAARFVLAFAVARLLLRDMDYGLEENLIPFLNPRFLTLSLVAGTLAAFGWMHRALGDRRADSQLLAWWTGAVFLLGLGMMIESSTYATLLWMALALLWLASTEGLPEAERGGFFALMIAVIVVRALGVDVSEYVATAETDPILNLRFVVLATLALFMGIAARLLPGGRMELREAEEVAEVRFSHLLLGGANMVLLYGLSLEVLLMVDRSLAPGLDDEARESARQFALSALWAAYGGALVAWGFLREGVAVRAVGLGLLGIVVLKLLFVDLANVETGWRIATFIGVGALLLLLSLAYHRSVIKDTSQEETVETDLGSEAPEPDSAVVHDSPE